MKPHSLVDVNCLVSWLLAKNVFSSYILDHLPFLGVSGTNQALRKLPHSSTLTDLLSSSRFGGSKGDVREEERGGTPVRTSDVDGSSSNSAVVGSMPTSKSENHLAGMLVDNITFYQSIPSNSCWFPFSIGSVRSIFCKYSALN